MSRAFCKAFDIFVATGVMNRGGYEKYMKSPMMLRFSSNTNETFSLSVGNRNYGYRKQAVSKFNGFEINLDRKIYAAQIIKFTRPEAVSPFGFEIEFTFTDGSKTLISESVSGKEWSMLTPLPDGFEYTPLIRRKFGIPPTA